MHAKPKNKKIGWGRPAHKGRCEELGANILWQGGGTRRTMTGLKYEQQHNTIQYGKVRV